MKKNRAMYIACGVYTIVMLISFIYLYSKGEEHGYQVAIGGILCGLAPLVVSYVTKMTFPFLMIASYVLFLIGSQLFGSIFHFYALGWWDTLLHFFSGVLLAAVAVGLYERFVQREATLGKSPLLLFLFLWSFATFGGVLWEIYEYSMDHFFGMTLQGGGNEDTMTDLIADTIGGLSIASVICVGAIRKLTKNKAALR